MRLYIFKIQKGIDILGYRKVGELLRCNQMIVTIFIIVCYLACLTIHPTIQFRFYVFSKSDFYSLIVFQKRLGFIQNIVAPACSRGNRK